jgi:transposase
LKLSQKTLAKEDAAPKALSCYGVWCPNSDRMLLRFVRGRPVSAVTTDFLAWVVEQLAEAGKKALLLVWDNATWHGSQIVKAWVKAHNRKVRQEGGVRIVVCPLPTKSPWLNPIEPKWLHGKRAILETERVLSPNEIQQRVCDHFGCQLLQPLSQPLC